MNAHTDDHITSGTLTRARLQLRGQVQGVGFRPFVFCLANALALDGWVRNVAAGVEIEVQGTRGNLDRFMTRLTTEKPPAARIEEVAHAEVELIAGARGFAIIDSTDGAITTAIAPDSAVCEDCLADMFDPANRRYRHPFAHCIRCGPRYTIAARLPYDRPRTAMARFVECGACKAERERPGNRRFHAQTNACPACGPRLWLCDRTGNKLACEDVIAEATVRLARGEILAIKGLGGFHLACDARNKEAVRLLRDRKSREEKPLAVMFANTESLREYAVANDADADLVASPQRPIVLLPKREGTDEALSGIAPGLASLGVMLPYTPVHYLLFHEAAGRPALGQLLNEVQPLALVMTSANPQGEPLVTGNSEAIRRLADIADAFLLHDRDILIRCEDSVIRGASTGTACAPAPQFVRRSRGFVPAPIRLDRSGAAGLAVGAYLNNTTCVVHGSEAFLSEHVGDLDTRLSCEAFGTTVSHLLDILQVEPAWVATDLHPDFHSTRFAHAFAGARGIPLIEVQHHHAHVAAVVAEHRLRTKVIGIALDGFGLGNDGAAWGGELLLVDGARSTRLGNLHPLRLPGGDRAAREPWRMAASALFELGRHDEIGRRFGTSAAMIETMLQRGLNAPPTSSAGRLFDAAAGLLGVKPVTSFEGQAAAMLEGLAASFGPVEPMRHGYSINGGLLNLMPLLARIADMNDKAHAAALFHATFAAGLAEWVMRAVSAHEACDVILAGGCFINGMLARTLRAALEMHGLRVFEAAAVPCGDGGLSLGQAWVALQQLHS